MSDLSIHLIGYGLQAVALVALVYHTDLRLQRRFAEAICRRFGARPTKYGCCDRCDAPSISESPHAE